MFARERRCMLCYQKKTNLFLFKKRRIIHQRDRRQTEIKHIENYKRNPILEHEGGEREEDFVQTKKYTNFVAFEPGIWSHYV